jgi:hypothetical protein
LKYLGTMGLNAVKNELDILKAEGTSRCAFSSPMQHFRP